MVQSVNKTKQQRTKPNQNTKHVGICSAQNDFAKSCNTILNLKAFDIDKQFVCDWYSNDFQQRQMILSFIFDNVKIYILPEKNTALPDRIMGEVKLFVIIYHHTVLAHLLWDSCQFSN